MVQLATVRYLQLTWMLGLYLELKWFSMPPLPLAQTWSLLHWIEHVLQKCLLEQRRCLRGRLRLESLMQPGWTWAFWILQMVLLAFFLLPLQLKKRWREQPNEL